MIMKKTVRITATLALALIIALFSACNTSQKEKENTANHLKELQSDLKDLNTSIDNLAQTENEQFKEEGMKIIDDFNHKISNFENQLKEDNQQIDYNTQQALDELKATLENIEVKLTRVNTETLENYAEIKSEIRYDFIKFGESVKNFFNNHI